MKTKAFLLLMVLFILSPTVIQAQTVTGQVPNSSFTISALNSNSSSIFMETAKAGDTLKLKVRVKNISSKSKQFTLYGTDVVPTLRGGWSYPLSNVEPTLFGTWIQEDPKKPILKAGQSKDFDFTVKVPKGTADGQYIAAIVSEEYTPATEAKNSDHMSTLTNTNMQLPLQVVININAKNAKHDLTFGKVYHEVQNNGLITVYVPHVNKGTVLEKPSGTLVLKDSTGSVIIKEPYTMDSVYVSTTGLYDLNIPNILIPGKYTLEYSLESGLHKGTYEFEVSPLDLMDSMDKADNVGSKYDLGFWAFLKEFWVWIVVVIAIILILLIVIIILLLRRRKEKDEEPKKDISKNV